MKQSHKKIIKVLSFSLFLMFFIISCSGKPDDKQIQENVTKHLQLDKNYAGVTSAVNEGVVTLSGMCEGNDCVTDIVKDVAGITGVSKVENNISKDNSTDMTMRTSLQSILIKYPGVQAEVTLGVIVLRGIIDRDNLEPLMSDLTKLNPEKIDNQLSVN
ncbi:MAG: hyperosmotically inducible protein [Flavobacteriales bacterium]|jgi:hyperosmotically inducible protein